MCRQVMQGADGRSRGCGLVEFASSDAARNAIASLHDTELGGRLIMVRQDKEDAGKSRGGGRGHVVTLSGGQGKGGAVRATDRWVPGVASSSREGAGDGLSSGRVYVGNLSYEVGNIAIPNDGLTLVIRLCLVGCRCHGRTSRITCDQQATCCGPTS
jgi:hypothetical protein